MKTKTISIFKAAPFLKDEEVPNVQIFINMDIEKALKNITLEDAYRIYDIEASKLSKALLESLPQGIMDRLIVQLMGDRAAKSGYMGVTGS